MSDAWIDDVKLPDNEPDGASVFHVSLAGGTSLVMGADAIAVRDGVLEVSSDAHGVILLVPAGAWMDAYRKTEPGGLPVGMTHRWKVTEDESQPPHA